MLSDPLLQSRYLNYINNRLELADPAASAQVSE
jgi:predicted glycosyl hydrolase (DUF1957 family)